MENNFSRYILEHGGMIKHLELPVEMSEGLGMCNPSVFIDNDGKILCNIRRVNYLFHLSLTNYWNTAYGPTNYHHPDKDPNLRTENYMCELDKNLDIKPNTLKHVNYQKYEPKWNFVGEEDVRIVRWDGKLYLTGCRRDTESTGISRMELSEMDEDMNEVSRTRVPAPGKNDSYCEKNWMAILDKPYCYVKWCNPVEIVEYDPKTNTTKDILVKDQKILSDDPLCDLRGSSQVLKVDNYYITLVHEVNLWVNRYNERSAKYFNRFLVWDENWNTVKLSQRFWFMNFPIEFTNGLAFDGKDFIIPFSVFDNSAYIAKLSKEAVFGFIGIGEEVDKTSYAILTPTDEYISDIYNPEKSYSVGIEHFYKKQFAEAHAFFIRAAELAAEDYNKHKKIGYDAYYMAQKCLEHAGNRMDKLIHQYNVLIQWDPSRYEAYFELSKLYYGADDNLNDHNNALGFASMANMLVGDHPIAVTYVNMEEKYMVDRVKMQYGVCCYRCSKDYIAVPVLKDLIENGHETIKNQVKSLNLNL